MRPVKPPSGEMTRVLDRLAVITLVVMAVTLLLTVAAFAHERAPSPDQHLENRA